MKPVWNKDRETDNVPGIEEELEYYKTVNSELLEELKNMRDIRQKQWRECAELAFIKGQVLLPWPEIERAEAVIAKAEGKR